MIYKDVHKINILLIFRFSAGVFVFYVTSLLVNSWCFQVVLLPLHYQLN